MAPYVHCVPDWEAEDFVIVTVHQSANKVTLTPREALVIYHQLRAGLRVLGMLTPAKEQG